jgi:two-component system sensor histidine kinase KdpD
MLFEASLRKRSRSAFYTAGIGLFWLTLLLGRRPLLAVGLLTLCILAAHFNLWIKEPQSADRLQKALLNSISHNLRTPLASIAGALSSLAEEQSLSPEVRRELIETARQEASKLNRLVGNLLDMSRLEAGTVSVRTELCDVQDVIGTALAQLGDLGRSHEISVAVPPGMPLVPMDFVLMTQVVQNLLENALKYSSVGTPVAVSARLAGTDRVEIIVTDRGIGIPDSEVDRVFERFYRGERASARDGGIGLGLSICKGFVEAHRGRIQARRRRQGGTAITVALPLVSYAGKNRPVNKIEEKHDGYRTSGNDRG